MQQATVRWQLKTFRGNVACCAGTTIGLFSLGKSLCAVCVVCSLWLARKKCLYLIYHVIKMISKTSLKCTKWYCSGVYFFVHPEIL